MNVVFLCIGAAKAGTDWLHQQLSSHPDVYLRSIKELHYFDALENGQLDRELEKHSGLQENLLKRIAKEQRTPDTTQALRLADRGAWMDVLERGEDTSAYLEYLTNGAKNGQVVADMTPAYALLPEERLSRMAAMSKDVRFLFLMRDPVERLWSHIRMIAVRRDPDGQISQKRCARLLQNTLSGGEEQISKRSDYAGTLKRLMAAVPGPQVLIDVFEEMVTGDGLVRICSFLGIAPVTPSLAPVHKGQALAMTRDQRQAAADWLAPQYEAAEQALGRMPESWAR